MHILTHLVNCDGKGCPHRELSSGPAEGVHTLLRTKGDSWNEDCSALVFSTRDDALQQLVAMKLLED